MQWPGDPQIWAALPTLTAIEIVLWNRQRHPGLGSSEPASTTSSEHESVTRTRPCASPARLMLLTGIIWLTKLTVPIFKSLGRSFSLRDLILIAGGAFLVYSGTPRNPQSY